ncbi:MAG TPA: hypothetical protein PK960_02925 [bacterium]|nr:hypothetical protein [bacterium]
METPLKTVNTQNLASLLIWQICQEYKNTLNKKEYWEARLQKMVRIKKAFFHISLFLVYLLVAYWLMSLAPSPSPTIFLDYVSGSIIGMAVISCLALLWAKQRVGHYQKRVGEINKGVVEFIKKRLNQILLSHTCFAHDDLDVVIDFYYKQLSCIVGDFFKESFTSPLSHEEEEEIRSWLKTSWPNFFISP